MATESWIDEALGEIFKEIQRGSSLSIDGHRKLYYDRYLEDFKKRTKEEWDEQKRGILQLAHLVGCLATTLTIIGAIRRGYIPTSVNQRSADLAGYLMAQVDIKPQLVRGHWCRSYPPPETGDEPTLKELQEFMQSLELTARAMESSRDAQA